jgi:hypothetical protein
MIAISGTVQNGVIVPREPIDWPDGTEVFIALSELALYDEMMDHHPVLGTSAEAIARWQAEFESLPVPQMTDEEWVAWEQRRREDKEWELAHAEERHKRIIQQWNETIPD